jgi:hypothetical protein
MSLLARLERVEKSHGVSHPWRNHRFCRTVTSEEQAEAARREVAAQRYDPNQDLLLIYLVESSGPDDELIVVRKP